MVPPAVACGVGGGGTVPVAGQCPLQGDAAACPMLGSESPMTSDRRYGAVCAKQAT